MLLLSVVGLIISAADVAYVVYVEDSPISSQDFGEIYASGNYTIGNEIQVRGTIVSIEVIEGTQFYHLDADSAIFHTTNINGIDTPNIGDEIIVTLIWVYPEQGHTRAQLISWGYA